MAQECDQFLDVLQQNNFNVFEPDVRAPSYVKVPYAMYAASKAGKF